MSSTFHADKHAANTEQIKSKRNHFQGLDSFYDTYLMRAPFSFSNVIRPKF